MEVVGIRITLIFLGNYSYVSSCLLSFLALFPLNFLLLLPSCLLASHLEEYLSCIRTLLRQFICFIQLENFQWQRSCAFYLVSLQGTESVLDKWANARSKFYGLEDLPGQLATTGDMVCLSPLFLKETYTAQHGCSWAHLPFSLFLRLQKTFDSKMKQR